MAGNSLMPVDRATLAVQEHPLGVELAQADAASLGNQLR